MREWDRTTKACSWATEAGKDRAVAAARLGDIEAREYTSDLIEDSGLEVFGFRLGGSERESWFLPLDGGAAAQDFRDQLQSAVADAR